MKNTRTLAALGAIGLVVAWLVRRYTSDPFASAVVTAPQGTDFSATLVGVVKQKPGSSAPVTTPAFPYSAGGTVPNIAPPQVLPTASAEVPKPAASPKEIEALWEAEQPHGTGEGFQFVKASGTVNAF